MSQTIISSQLENKDSTAIQNTSDILNTDDIHSCVTPRKHNISVQDTSTPPPLTTLITTLPLAPVNSTGARGKVVINGVKQGVVDMA